MIGKLRATEAIDVVPAGENAGYMDLNANVINEAIINVSGSDLKRLGFNDVEDRDYKFFRSREALLEPKTLDSLFKAPFVSGHEPVTAANWNERVIGQPGSYPKEVSDGAGVISMSYRMASTEAQRDFKAGEKGEISTQYVFDPVLQPGTWNGKEYDGILSNMQFEHVAVVGKGQNGPSMRLSEEAEMLNDSDKKWFEALFEKMGLKARSTEEQPGDEPDDKDKGTSKKRTHKNMISIEEHERIVAKEKMLASDRELVLPHLKNEQLKLQVMEMDDSVNILGYGLAAMGVPDSEIANTSADELRGRFKQLKIQASEEDEDAGRSISWNGAVNGVTSHAEEANNLFAKHADAQKKAADEYRQKWLTN